MIIMWSIALLVYLGMTCITFDWIHSSDSLTPAQRREMLPWHVLMGLLWPFIGAVVVVMLLGAGLKKLTRG